MSEQKVLERLRRAAERKDVADAERHAATAELRRRVREARDAGLGPTRIAQEAGLSRQAVYELLAERPA